MFAIEFIRQIELAAVDAADAHWTRMLDRYEAGDKAEQEREWLELEGEGYVYRVVEVAS
jgi:hypothetical protein